MPAEYEDGFSVREPMWHGLGVILPDYLSRADSFAVSGQNWTVERKPIAVQMNDFGTTQLADGWFGAVRSDNGGILHVHRDSYQELQNTEGWDLADAFADQDRAIRYETAACLQDGKTCFVLLEDEGFTIGGDSSKTKTYILVSWSHDGSAAMTARKTRVRVVCRNTLDMALAGSQAEFSFKHTRKVRDRIEAAKAALTAMREDTVLYRNLMESLQATRVFRPGIAKFLDGFTGPVTTSEEVSDLQARANAKARFQVISLLNGPTVDGNETRGFTGYDILNAAVEYLDFGRKAKSDETRFTRTYLKDDDRKNDLVNQVLAVVN